MQRSDFDPRLSPLLGDLIDRRRKLIDAMAQQRVDGDPEALASMMVQLGMLQGCIFAVTEVIAEAKATAKLES